MLRKSIIFLTVIVMPFIILAQKENGFKITGNISGLKKDEKAVLLLMAPYGWNFERIDSTYLKNGEFSLKGQAVDGPRFFWIQFEQSGKTVRLLLTNGDEVKISGKSVSHDYLEGHLQITGSFSNQGWRTLVGAANVYRSARSRLNNDMIRVKDSIGFDLKVLNGIVMAKKGLDDAFNFNFFRNVEDSLKSAIPFTAFGESLFEISRHASFWIDGYNSMDARIRNSFYGKILKEQIQLCVGQPLPEFAFPDSSGRTVPLREVLAKGKITLIHFWATHSVDRKRFQEELKALYKKYSSRGLNIIGVSSDSFMDEWKAMLASEKYPWNNLIDQNGRVVDSVYHEYGDPEVHNTTNVLLDDKGKIIAWDVNGVELQWYLAKTLGE